MKKILFLYLAILTVAVVAAVSADELEREGYAPGSMMGYTPGMMGQGYGSGMMDPGGGFGPMMMGPGMMMGYGSGMMGPGAGFTPGMMMGPSFGMMEMMHQMMHGGIGSGMEGHFAAGFYLGFKEMLELSDEQIASLEAIGLSFGKEAIRKGADIRIAELELGMLLDQDQLDLNQIETRLREADGLRTELKLSRIRALESAKNILTEEQHARWESLKRGNFATFQGMEHMEEMMKEGGM